MIKTIIGLILLLCPFLLIYKFQNKKLGFAQILSFIILFQLIIAILTQMFKIFNYPTILVLNFFLLIIIFKKTDFKALKENIKNIKIDWILILIILIVFIQLFSVHYNYTGKITTINEDFKEVQNMKYPYPYYSDEWVAISLIQYSLKSNSLPLVNPLDNNSIFPNLELPFHSFISELILLLNLNPLTQYTILTVFINLLICILVYLILRLNKIQKIPSAIASLSIPYITNGANLPGIWVLFPLSIGIISLLLGFLFISTKKPKMILLLGFLTLIFYPPLFLLYTPALIVYFSTSKNYFKKEKIKYLQTFFLICIIIVFILSFFILISKYDFNHFSEYIYSKILYKSFTPNALPNYSINNIIPLSLLFMGLIGILNNFKKRLWIITPIITGLIFWIIYNYSKWRVIIEYERVIFSTSILIILFSGIGIQKSIEYLNKIYLIKKYNITKILSIIILILFFISAFFYTQRTNWTELKLYANDGKIISPSSPANNYFNKYDLKLFENITNKNFLTIPWKGLVIGVATENYPLETKESTITNKKLKLIDFMKLNCEQKTQIAKSKKIDYIYSPKFHCPKFNLIEISNEGPHLYETQ